MTNMRNNSFKAMPSAHGNSTALSFSVNGEVCGKSINCKLSLVSWIFTAICSLYLLILFWIAQGRISLLIPINNGAISPSSVLTPKALVKESFIDNKLPRRKTPEITTSTRKSVPKEKVVNGPLSDFFKIKPSLDRGIFFANQFFALPIPKVSHLILGMAAQIDAKYLAVFIKSLRETAGSDVTVILFTGTKLDAMTAQLTRQYDIHFIPFEQEKMEPAFIRKYHVSTIRWILFHRLFRENRDYFQRHFQSILTTDVRDTFFQSNPFSLPIILNSQPVVGNRLFAFAESDETTIATCGWNSGWIKDCFGSNALSMVSRQNILCSGVVMSNSFTAMADYVSIMNNLFLGYLPYQENQTDPRSLFPRCERNGVDQGAHNYLIYSSLLAKTTTSVQILYPTSFPVIHMQSMMNRLDGLFSTSPPFLIMNQAATSNSPYAIVHQYDRHKGLQDLLAKKYVDWIDWSHSFSSEWEQTAACRQFTYEEDVDVLKGKCDAGVTRAMTASGCCENCLQQPSGSCTAFTFVDGTCFLKNCAIGETKTYFNSFYREVYRETNPNLRDNDKLTFPVDRTLPLPSQQQLLRLQEQANQQSARNKQQSLKRSSTFYLEGAVSGARKSS